MTRSFRRKLAVSTAVVAAGLVVAACGGSKAHPSQAIQALRIGSSSAFANLDVADAGPGREQDYVLLGLEPLTDMTGDGTPHMVLAQSIEHPDPTTYVYHIRRGVKFWNGHPLTAEDVAYSLNYYRKPESKVSAAYPPVKSISAAGPDTVVVKLPRPTAAWPLDFAGAGSKSSAGIFEKAFQQAHKSTFGKPGTLVMGTGGWKFTSLNPTRGLELTANPNWWAGKVKIQRISVRFYSQETSMGLAFAAGQGDLAFVNNARLFKASAGSSATIHAAEGPSFVTISMPTTDPPWNDIHVRRAVAYAMNPDDLIRANGAPGRRTTTIIPESQLAAVAPRDAVTSLFTSLPTYNFDLAKAKQEMGMSAHPNGFAAVLNTVSDFSFPQMGQVLAAQLQQIGIKLTIHAQPLAQWLSKLSSHRNIGLQLISPGVTTPDPSGFPAFILGTPQAQPGHLANIAGWTPPEIDRLMTAGLSTPNGVERLNVYGEILKSVGTDLPYVPIMSRDATLALSKKFTWPTFGFYLPANWAQQVQPAA